jgi:hypothetical protein
MAERRREERSIFAHQELMHRLRHPVSSSMEMGVALTLAFVPNPRHVSQRR